LARLGKEGSHQVRAAAADEVAVDHIVVQQERVVQQLDRGCNADGCAAVPGVFVESVIGFHEQQRPHEFSTENVLAGNVPEPAELRSVGPCRVGTRRYEACQFAFDGGTEV
jgi:hypothetical protein